MAMLTLTLFSSFFIASTALLAQRKHLLMCLLSLEALMLILILGLTVSSSLQNEMFMCLLILTLAVCEASLGLAILVKMLRKTGSDRLTNTSMTKC